MKKRSKISYAAICLILLCFIVFSCEYERVQTKAPCNLNELNFKIDSISSNLLIECGSTQGEIVLSFPDSLIGKMTFSIDNGEFLKVNSFSSLGAGSYSITAQKEGTNCISNSVSVNVSNENGINLTIENVQNTSCGVSTGVIELNQSGGVDPIEYKLNNQPFQSDPVFTGLSSDTYTITARDANGCESSVSNVNITSDVSFSRDIRNIITTNCAVTGCHNGSQPPDFSQVSNIINNASRIRSRTSNGSMPPSGRDDLSQNEIDLIACWVEDGALNN